MTAVQPSSSPAPQVGMVLGERYRLEAALGSGGMAEVYRALDLISGRKVAVKVLRQQLTESPEAVQRFRREGQVLAALKNPAVVGVEAVLEQPGGLVFLVMELLEGETLGARMKRGPMSVRELAPIVAGCAAGLSAAHQSGVVHRDLKPDNVFLAQLPGGEVQVKVLDFGVSKVRGEEKLTQTGQVLGTPRYMSPEQLGAEPDVDPRVDVYALGVILYEALSGGKSPFLASTPTDLIVAILNGKTVPLRSVKPDVPNAIEGVVQRAMAKVRAARYASVAELADAFFEAGAFELKSSPKPPPGASALGTSVLGSMRTVALGQQGGELALAATKLAPPASSSKAAEPLREGTFSELSAFDVPPPSVEAAPAPPPAVEALGPTRSPRPIPPTAISSAVAPAAPITETRPPDARPAPRPPVRVDVSDPGLVPEPAPSPVRSGLLLVTVGLLAGGLAAGAVIAVLTWFSQANGTLDPPPPPPPPVTLVVSDGGAAPDAGPSPAPATGALVGAETGGERGAVAGELAGARTGTEAGAAEGATEGSGTGSTGTGTEGSAGGAGASGTEGSAGGAGASGTEGSGTAGASGTGSSGTGTGTSGTGTSGTEGAGSSGGAGTGTGSSGTGTGGSGGAGSRGGAGTRSGGDDDAVDPITAARRALARGDAAECIDILDDVIPREPSPRALRLRADCLLRAGEVSEAISDYQRFCRVLPDSPSISEVREILEGLGQTCP